MVANEHNFKPYYYNALGLEREAGAADIEKAYPVCRNKIGRDANYRYRETQLNEAYKVLSDPGLRPLYDMWLDEFLETRHGISSATGKVEVTSAAAPVNERGKVGQILFWGVFAAALIAGAWQLSVYFKEKPKEFRVGDTIIRPGTSERYLITARNKSYTFYTGQTGDAYELRNLKSGKVVWYGVVSVGRSFEVDASAGSVTPPSPVPAPTTPAESVPSATEPETADTAPPADAEGTDKATENLVPSGENPEETPEEPHSGEQ